MPLRVRTVCPKLAAASLMLLLSAAQAAAGQAEIDVFVKELMPRLMEVANENGVKRSDGERLEDVMAAIYSLASARGRFPLVADGKLVWDERVKAEVEFMAALWSLLPWWPKEAETRNQAIAVRRELTQNGFKRMVARLAIESKLGALKPEDVMNFAKARKPPSPATEMVDFKAALRVIKP